MKAHEFDAKFESDDDDIVWTWIYRKLKTDA